MTSARITAGLLAAAALLAVDARGASAQEPPISPPTTVATSVSPAPYVGPAAPPASIECGSGDKPGLFDVGEHVEKVINTWFCKIVTDGIAPTLDTIGATALQTPDVGNSPRVRDLWRMSWGIANSVYVLAIVAAGVLLLTHETLQTSYTVKELAPRLIVGWITLNVSLTLASLSIEFANSLSSAILAAPLGEATKPLTQMATAPLENGGIFIILLALVVLVFAVVLLCVCALRIFTVITLVAAAPLMLAAHALPTTDGMARLWWRAFGGCLGVQVAQSIALGAAVRVLFDSEGRRAAGLPGGRAMDLVIVMCVLWLLIRIPGYASRFVFTTRPTTVLQAARRVVFYRALGAGRSR